MIFRILFYLTIAGSLASLIASGMAFYGSYSLEGVMVRWHEKNLADGLNEERLAGYQNQTLVLLKLIRGILGYTAISSVIVFAMLIAAIRKFRFRGKEVQSPTL